MNRRTVLAAMTALVPAGMLAACSGLKTNPLQNTITVNLATAQAQAQTIEAALKIEAANVASHLSANVNELVNKALGDLSSAVAAFVGLPTGSMSVATFANGVIAAASALVALLPLPAATLFAINTGLGILTALIAGAATITVPVAPAAASRDMATVVPGPVPVPVR